MPENFLYSKYSLFVLLLIFLSLIVALGRETYLNFKISQEINKLEQEIEGLKRENAEMAEIEKQLQSKEFLEKEGRLKLNLVRDGEKLIIIKDETKNEGSTSPSETEKTERLSNPRKWWNYFFKR